MANGAHQIVAYTLELRESEYQNLLALKENPAWSKCNFKQVLKMHWIFLSIGFSSPKLLSLVQEAW